MRLSPCRRSATGLAATALAASLALSGTVTTSPAAASEPRTHPLASTTVSALGSAECLGFNGLDNPRIIGNDPRADLIGLVMDDSFKAPGEKLRKVGNGSGDINWNQPKITVSGRTWLNSLKWLGPLLTIERDKAAKWSPKLYHYFSAAEKQQHLDHALRVAKDWVSDHPQWERTDPRSQQRSAQVSTAHRLQVLTCLRQAAGAVGWLDAAIARHVAHLVGPRSGARFDHARYVQRTWKPAASWPRWQGPNNVGLDQSLGVLAAACTLGRRDWWTVAVRRIERHASKVYDKQGVDNEQAPGYSAYNYGLWNKTLDRLSTCGDSGRASSVTSRLQAAPEFLAMAHRPDGRVEQLGDTQAQPQPIVGTAAEYAATLGAAGPVPAARAGVYNSGSHGGYVFGHSGWGTERPFTQESFYSLRFGNGRKYHGHDDHTSVTYYAKGQQLLADGGHPGYARTKYRDYAISPMAHNVVVPKGAAFDHKARTDLTSSVQTAGGDAYVMRDKAFSGVTRQRSVLAVVTPQPDMVLVADTLTSAERRRYDQLWHLGPQFATSVAGGAAKGVASGLGLTVLPIALSGKGSRVTTVRGSNKPIQGWVSPRAKSRTATSTVVVSQTGASVQMLTAIVPASAGSVVTGSASPSAAGGWDVTVTIDGSPTTAHLSAAGVLSR